jgi:hypothetical protein
VVRKVGDDDEGDEDDGEDVNPKGKDVDQRVEGDEVRNVGPSRIQINP